MLDKYLEEKGNVAISELQTWFPDLAELLQSYTDLKDSADPSFKEELDAIESEITSQLKERDAQIDEFALQRTSISAPGEESIIDIDVEEIDVTPESQPIGYHFTEVEFTKDSFLKLLSILGIDFQPKVKSDGSAEDKFFWLLDEVNYIITVGMPFGNKIDLYVFGDDRERENYYTAIQSKASSYGTKSGVIEANVTPDLTSDNLQNFVSPDFVEPMTGMQFKHVDDAVIDLFKIDSAPKLLALLELSTGKKYGCGCGSV
jgi:hypothetical protein